MSVPGPIEQGPIEPRPIVAVIQFPGSNDDGDAELVAVLEARGQIVLRYTEDVNGSLGRIAGVANEAGNVMGLMPHPEHAVDPLLGPTGGLPILQGLVAAAQDHALVSV